MKGGANSLVSRHRATRSDTNVGRSSGTRKVASMPTCIGVRWLSVNSQAESLVFSSLRATAPLPMASPEQTVVPIVTVRSCLPK